MTEANAEITLENVLYEARESIAYIRMNRPDMAELSTMKEEATASFSVAGQAVLTFFEELGKPVIAAVNGFTLGGGCETAMGCTFRIAAENARFGQPQVKLAIIAGYGGTQRLPGLAGKWLALQLILTGETISAQEAYRIGLVNEVVKPEELIPRAEAILRQIAANAPLAVKYSIEAVNNGLRTDLTTGLRREAELFALAANTHDRIEGTSAFVKKQAPHLKGR